MIIGAFWIKWVWTEHLVPIWGINGSAVATVISLFTLCIVIFVELKRNIPALLLLKQINRSAFGKASACMVGYIMIIGYLIPYEAIQSRFFLLLYVAWIDRKSTRLNSSHVAISYAVFCLKKKKKNNVS